MRRVFKHAPALAARKRRRANMLLNGIGGETLQDRGAQNVAALHTRNPYFNNDIFARWQEYVRWYMTSWEARKIIDLPVQDALRNPVEIHGLEEEDKKRLEDAYEHFNIGAQKRRALIQERLLGGALILPVFNRPDFDDPKDPLLLRTIEKGDLLAINVVDVSMVSTPFYEIDPFSPTYDRVDQLNIQSQPVHSSRFCLLNGERLFNSATQGRLESGRYNITCFGESKLSPLYDLLIRATGTQQGAYHLVNMASVLLVAAGKYRQIEAANSPAKRKLEEVCEMISIYRGAVIDGDDVEVKQHSATFGSVPELVSLFMQLLAAGSDIPATRFLGVAPAGLNATGESDLENYYNFVESWLHSRIKPVDLRLFNWLGAHLWGWRDWQVKSKNFELVYPPLWNASKVEQAQTDVSYADIYRGLYQDGLISAADAVRMIKDREILAADIEAEEFIREEPVVENPFGTRPNPFGGF